MARLLFAPSMNIQAPPNLNPGALHRLIEAGINDWGGVSPVTPDHVNPEAPWPELEMLERATNAAGKQLVERLAIYPAFARRADAWVDPALRTSLLRRIDADGWPRTDEWSPGTLAALPGPAARTAVRPLPAIYRQFLARAQAGSTLGEADIVRLFRARGDEFAAVCAAADELRHATNGDVVSYVVTRNINYTNICYFRCQFCAFSKGKISENLRGRPYDLPLAEVERRVREAWSRGATEVCMQGGIHPSYTGARYLDICRAVKSVASRTFTSMHFRRSKCIRAQPRSASRSRNFFVRCKQRASARCRAPPPKSSMTRCAPCSAPTRSEPANGWRSCARRIAPD